MIGGKRHLRLRRVSMSWKYISWSLSILSRLVLRPESYSAKYEHCVKNIFIRKYEIPSKKFHRCISVESLMLLEYPTKVYVLLIKVDAFCCQLLHAYRTNVNFILYIHTLSRHTYVIMLGHYRSYKFCNTNILLCVFSFMTS